MSYPHTDAARTYSVPEQPSFDYFIGFIRGVTPNRFVFKSEKFLRAFGLYDDFTSFIKEADNNIESKLFLYTLRIVGDYVSNVLADYSCYVQPLTSSNYAMIGYVLYRAFTDKEPNSRLLGLIDAFPDNITKGVTNTFELLKIQSAQSCNYAKLVVGFMYENWKPRES